MKNKTIQISQCKGTIGLRMLLLFVLLVIGGAVLSFATTLVNTYTFKLAQQTTPILQAATKQETKIQPTKKPRPKGDMIVVRHADQTSYDEALMPGVQIFVGNVEFFYNGTVLKCDSANFFKDNNSFAAFDNVNMQQGDSLSLKCQYLFYDGNSQVAQARHAVVLKHRKKSASAFTILTTDSLDYDRLYSMGYFFEGGKLVDDDNTLTSDWGQYDAKLRRAVFNYNVNLKSPKYEMHTDTLYYNVQTKDARAAGNSDIISGTSTINTINGIFNTSSNKAILLNRSVVNDKGSSMVADSIVYDKDNDVAEGFGDFVYSDENNKTTLTGDYCYYNDSTGYCMAHGKALVKNYTEPDTLYLHADTIMVQSYNLHTDSVYRIVQGYYHSRSYRTDVQSVADSLFFNSKSRILSLFGNPVVWNQRNQIVGEEIHTFFNDSTIDSIRVINQALVCEKLDSLHYNQITSKDMYMYFDTGQMKECRAIQNVKINYFQLDDKVADTIAVSMNHAETSLMRLFFENKKVHSVWTSEVDGRMYPIIFVDKPQLYLENFAWFDYMRPKNKDDVFVWHDKPADKMLKKTERRKAPLQYLKR